ncbi:hypothetical protein [Streptomyces sp. NPDC096311]|uniref:hypothetical protein n=1 Tax=Streptomyces sp. NPDC096311 TaxID=3366083 RepID=UPI00382D140E
MRRVAKVVIVGGGIAGLASDELDVPIEVFTNVQGADRHRPGELVEFIEDWGDYGEKHRTELASSVSHRWRLAQLHRAWQHGAFTSARKAVTALHTRVLSA